MCPCLCACVRARSLKGGVRPSFIQTRTVKGTASQAKTLRRCLASGRIRTCDQRLPAQVGWCFALECLYVCARGCGSKMYVVSKTFLGLSAPDFCVHPVNSAAFQIANLRLRALRVGASQRLYKLSFSPTHTVMGTNKRQDTAQCIPPNTQTQS